MTNNPLPRLTFELVPATSWYRNVRANVSPMTWSSLQQLTFTAAGRRCEICGNVGPRHPVECHEVWSYDDRWLVQRLERLIALCPRCHQVKHLGHTLAKAKRDHVEATLEWYCLVNAASPEVALRHLQEAFTEHARRSASTYQVDVKLLRQYGVAIDARGVEIGHTPTGLDF